jgi:DNA-binding NtrC family response regulator
MLVTFGWPGNVRELANAIERASALAPGALLTREDFAFLVDTTAGGNDAIPVSLAELPLNDALAQLERALIARALALTDGNRAEAARRLGISRQSLYTRLASLGISGADA